MRTRVVGQDEENSKTVLKFKSRRDHTERWLNNFELFHHWLAETNIDASALKLYFRYRSLCMGGLQDAQESVRETRRIYGWSNDRMMSARKHLLHIRAITILEPEVQGGSSIIQINDYDLWDGNAIADLSPTPERRAEVARMLSMTEVRIEQRTEPKNGKAEKNRNTKGQKSEREAFRKSEHLPPTPVPIIGTPPSKGVPIIGTLPIETEIIETKKDTTAVFGMPPPTGAEPSPSGQVSAPVFEIKSRKDWVVAGKAVWNCIRFANLMKGIWPPEMVAEQKLDAAETMKVANTVKSFVNSRWASNPKRGIAVMLAVFAKAQQQPNQKWPLDMSFFGGEFKFSEILADVLKNPKSIPSDSDLGLTGSLDDFYSIATDILKKAIENPESVMIPSERSETSFEDELERLEAKNNSDSLLERLILESWRSEGRPIPADEDFSNQPYF